MIQMTDAIALMKNRPNATIIDVRSRQEFIEGHIAGAINIPLIYIRDYPFSKNQTIILYCNAGIRSVKAKYILEKRGYKDIYILDPNL